MNLEPISNDKAYRAALTEVDSLMTAPRHYRGRPARGARDA